MNDIRAFFRNQSFDVVVRRNSQIVSQAAEKRFIDSQACIGIRIFENFMPIGLQQISFRIKNNIFPSRMLVIVMH